MKKKLMLFLTVVVGLIAISCSKQEKESKLDPKNPVDITVWHYYNGEQLDAFNTLVEEFNSTQGKEIGIEVESVSQATVEDLENYMLNAVSQEVGAEDLPNVCAAYADTAYKMYEKGYVADISNYLTEEEKETYNRNFIEEGQFENESSLEIFPVAKATEVLVLNKTDWELFANEKDVDLSLLNTYEGIVKVSEEYYEWTDQQTKTQNDGKAFFGRDSMANYMIVGMKQLGHDVVTTKEGKTTVDFDKEAVRMLWDNYYVPYVKGYFVSQNRFRSDDFKLGSIISFVGSSAGATYFPDEITKEEDLSYKIEVDVTNPPVFEEGENVAVQQGAGMIVLKQTEEQEEASVEFLKWFTNKEQNTEFAINSGYMPVTTAALDKDNLEEAMEEDDTKAIVKDTILTSTEVMGNYELFTLKPFASQVDVRDILEYSISDQAAADRNSVLEAIKSGSSYEKAVKMYVSDENFEKWYKDTKKELEEAVN